MDFGFVGNGASLHDLTTLAGHLEDAWKDLLAATPDD